MLARIEQLERHLAALLGGVPASEPKLAVAHLGEQAAAFDRRQICSPKRSR
jgi:hypothetical protein